MNPYKKVKKLRQELESSKRVSDNALANIQAAIDSLRSWDGKQPPMYFCNWSPRFCWGNLKRMFDMILGYGFTFVLDPVIGEIDLLTMEVREWKMPRLQNPPL